jgi:hypothetical protein
VSQRVEAEVALLRLRYARVDVAPDDTWVIVREVVIPDGWDRRAVDVLIVIPPGYPVTPPDNFFVPQGLRLGSGASIQNYSEPVSILAQSWGQFSFHCQDWVPSPTPADGDNLLTVMIFVEHRLGEIN